MMHNTGHPNNTVDQPTRRQFLKASALGAICAMGAIEGCGRGASTTEPSLEADITHTESTAIDATTDERAPATTTPTANATDSTLRIAFGNVALQFDPAVTITNAAIQAIILTYEGLVRIGADLTVQPALAERWEASDDLLIWTFTLRQKVLFHHGTPFTAKDVVYTFQRLMNPTVGSSLYNVLTMIDTIEVVDDGTETGGVRFLLNQAYADLPMLCGAPQAVIIAHDYAVEELAQSPSGTGPYFVDAILPGQQISFVRNAAHWAVDAYPIQMMQHTYLPVFDARAAALRAGNVDMLPDISSSEAAALSKTGTDGGAAITLIESPSGAYQTVVMQATEAPFTDVRVRQALKLSIDRQAIQARLLDGRGEIGADHPVASSSPYYSGLTAEGYDPERAKALLADAGYPNGVRLDLITSAVDPGMVELAYLVQEMAAAAGFVITPTEVPADVYWDSYWMQVPFHIGSWNFRPNIDETFALAFHSKSQWNESRWMNADFDRLIESARSEPDQEQRRAIYQQAEQLLMREGAVIIPLFRPVLTAVNERVQAFVAHPSGWIDPRGLAINGVETSVSIRSRP